MDNKKVSLFFFILIVHSRQISDAGLLGVEQPLAYNTHQYINTESLQMTDARQMINALQMNNFL